MYCQRLKLCGYISWLKKRANNQGLAVGIEHFKNEIQALTGRGILPPKRYDLVRAKAKAKATIYLDFWY